MRIRRTTPADGAALWQLVRDSEALELNSQYFYVLMATHFASTCRLAEDEDGRAAGFVVGHRPPGREDTVFVWQVGVADHARRQGLANRLLEDLARSLADEGVRWLEATVSPDNLPSRALFTSFARRRGVEAEVRPFLGADLFPGQHEPEDLFRIGPLAPPARLGRPADSPSATLTDTSTATHCTETGVPP